MSKQTQIEEILHQSFTPLFLEVVNESANHNVPAGSESHFKVTLVAESFVDKKLIARHRLVNAAMAEMMPNIHALALHTYTPDEWQQRQTAPESPECMGGGK
ncbi:MAG: BolA/IbaG family iron-sulfur metabolism protein [Gammaproteobacteria bacterium]|nr:BolA/IbaG family iron-sulfur metabolism protein [Gammaproteobacteria bacterium]